MIVKTKASKQQNPAIIVQIRSNFFSVTTTVIFLSLENMCMNVFDASLTNVIYSLLVSSCSSTKDKIMTDQILNNARPEWKV